jgi:hypothetical protein
MLGTHIIKSMAFSVPIWKIYGFPKVSLYLERFVLKHAKALIHRHFTQFDQTTNTMELKCLWCLEEEPKVTFNKKAHTIPKSLGGQNYNKNVCDSCN